MSEQQTNFIHIEGNLRGVRYKFTLDAGTRGVTLEDFDSAIDIIDFQRGIAFREEVQAANDKIDQDVANVIMRSWSYDDGAWKVVQGAPAEPAVDKQEAPTPPDRRSACPACGSYVTVNADGSLRVHGPKHARCSGVAPQAIQAQPEATPEAATETQEAKDWFEDDEPSDPSATTVDALASTVF